MKNLTASVFQVLYSMTGLKSLSYGVALVYMTILNMIMINGLSVLMQDIIPGIGQLHRLFVLPVAAATFVVMLGLTFVLSPKREQIAKDGKKIKKFTIISVYSLIGLLLLTYSIVSKKM